MNTLSEESNFLGSFTNSTYERSKFVVQSFPFERTSSYVVGSAKGPESILKASHYVEFFDEELKIDTREKFGIATLLPSDFKTLDMEEALKQMENESKLHADANKFLVTLGAEHTVSYPIFKALQRKYTNLSVLQLDAHADLRSSYEGNPFSHACVMARIQELSPKMVQVGIRAYSSEEQTRMDENRDQILAFNDFDLQGKPIPVSPVLEHLTDDVYITIDADGFAPHIAPEVGTPEPGGLEWYQSLNFLKEVMQHKNVVGFDVVECCPSQDPSPTAYTLAKLVYKLMGYAHLNPNNSLLYPIK